MKAFLKEKLPLALEKYDKKCTCLFFSCNFTENPAFAEETERFAFVRLKFIQERIQLVA